MKPWRPDRQTEMWRSQNQLTAERTYWLLSQATKAVYTCVWVCEWKSVFKLDSLSLGWSLAPKFFRSKCCSLTIPSACSCLTQDAALSFFTSIISALKRNVRVCANNKCPCWAFVQALVQLEVISFKHPHSCMHKHMKTVNDKTTSSMSWERNQSTSKYFNITVTLGEIYFLLMRPTNLSSGYISTFSSTCSCPIVSLLNLQRLWVF